MPMQSNKSLAKALDLLEACIAARGEDGLQAISAQLNIPVPTAYRLAATLQEYGYLLRSRHGKYFPGPTLYRLANNISTAEIAAGISRPVLTQLAKKFRCVAHFGVFEDEMVSYLVRVGDASVMTEEGKQFEAYCSAIGKVLLADLPDEERDAYLDSGSFTALTSQTIVDPVQLRAELCRVRENGHAIDNREIFEDLVCIAVPVWTSMEDAVGAISISIPSQKLSKLALIVRLKALKAAATKIQFEIGF